MMHVRPSDQFDLAPLIRDSRTPAYVVHLPTTTLYFSYGTLVAFRHPTVGLVCRENMWGPTTGKHLNAIEPNHAKRVSGERFDALLTDIQYVLVGLAVQRSVDHA